MRVLPFETCGRTCVHILRLATVGASDLLRYLELPNTNKQDMVCLEHSCALARLSLRNIGVLIDRIARSRATRVDYAAITGHPVPIAEMAMLQALLAPLAEPGNYLGCCLTQALRGPDDKRTRFCRDFATFSRPLLMLASVLPNVRSNPPPTRQVHET
jgi:hypothetical protein